MPGARPCSRAVGIIVAAISRLRWFGATLFGLDDLSASVVNLRGARSPQ
jgi:hypothetical protein